MEKRGRQIFSKIVRALLLHPFSFLKKKTIPIWVCPVDEALFYNELILKKNKCFLLPSKILMEKKSNNQIYDCPVFSISCLQTKSLRCLGHLTCLPDLVVINGDWAELLLIGSKGRGSSRDVWAGELQAVSSAGVIALLALFCCIGTENAPFAIEEDCLGENCSVDFLR